MSLIAIVMRRKLMSLQRPAMVLYTRKYAANPKRCDAHMNELPIPCGPWDVYYKDQQAYYTKTLLFGAIWFLFSFILMIASGSFYLNWGPPAQPGPPSDMVEECEDE